VSGRFDLVLDDAVFGLVGFDGGAALDQFDVAIKVDLAIRMPVICSALTLTGASWSCAGVGAGEAGGMLICACTESGNRAEAEATTIAEENRRASRQLTVRSVKDLENRIMKRVARYRAGGFFGMNPLLYGNSTTSNDFLR